MRRQNRMIFALLAASLAMCAPAQATQNELVPPVAGIFTGPQWSQKVGDAFRSLASCQKGNTAPANVGGATVDGLCWIDDSGSPWVQKRFVNGSWAIEGYLDPSTSTFAGVIGGGTNSISSSATTDLNSVPQANVSITGTTTISSFGSAAPAGVVKFVRFTGVLTLTNSASLLVPGGFDLTTAANDRAIVTHLGSGNWEITQYTRANGVPIDISAVGKPDFTFSASVPPLHVRGTGQAPARTSYPAYLAKVTRAQNGTRTSGNATITGIADTTGFGVGMPVESTGVNAGCTLASFVANTSITLNSSGCVTANGTSTVTVFLTGYGTSGSSSTVGAPDCRGRGFAGRDNADPGSLANLLTSTYFGTDSSAFNAIGGGESKFLVTANQPPYTPVGTLNLVANVLLPFGLFGTNASAVKTTSASGASGTDTFTGAVSFTTSTFTGTPQGGTSTPFRTVPPTLIAECVVRVIP